MRFSAVSRPLTASHVTLEHPWGLEVVESPVIWQHDPPIACGVGLAVQAGIGVERNSSLSRLTPAAPDEIAAATSETCEAYEQGASRYIEVTQEYSAYPGIREEVIAFANATSDGAPVLDLGCGSGRDALLLAAVGKHVVAGDICKAFLDYLRNSTSSGYVDNVRCVCLDICAIPFSESRFAGIWACGSLLHLPSTKMPQGLSEVLRVLEPNGTAAISMRIGSAEGWRTDGTLPGRRWFTLVDAEEFASLMEKIGFRDLNCRYVGRSGWFLVTGHKRHCD